MPVVTVEGPELKDMNKKRRLAKAITDAAVEAFGLPASTMVVILHENPQECVASGGELICDREAPRD
jgi:4-oxalocrotonate tautomerase family enzyme